MPEDEGFPHRFPASTHMLLYRAQPFVWLFAAFCPGSNSSSVELGLYRNNALDVFSQKDVRYHALDISKIPFWKMEYFLLQADIQLKDFLWLKWWVMQGEKYPSNSFSTYLEKKSGEYL